MRCLIFRTNRCTNVTIARLAHMRKDTRLSGILPADEKKGGDRSDDESSHDAEATASSPRRRQRIPTLFNAKKKRPHQYHTSTIHPLNHVVEFE